MTKEAFKYLLEIFVISFLLAFSIPSWNLISASTKRIDLQNESLEQGLQIHLINKTDTKIIDSNYDFTPVSFFINNNSKTNKKGEILLLYSKLSTINYKDLIIYVNKDPYDLCDLIIIDNKDYYIFKIKDLILDSYSYMEYTLNYKVKNDVTFDKIIGKYFDAKLEITQNS
ncbi:MAG: hypothetical protein PHF21_02415 [Bacilli bacterium]|nr:hypothetical protein [Bacilli bacterium]